MAVKQNEFVNYLLELLAPFGNVSARTMFGGHGIYRDGLIFGVVIDDTLYLKADDINRHEFLERNLDPFVYESKSKGKIVSLGYYRCPEEALESSALMQNWAKSAYGAALRKAGKAAVKKTAVKRPAKVKKA